VNVPESAGETLPGPLWFKPSVPLPVPTLAVTVQLVPLPVTEVMAEPVSPVAARLNAEALTPVTLRLKLTLHETVEVMVLCAQAEAQLMAVTAVAGVV
jgi:hypothetical protein